MSSSRKPLIANLGTCFLAASLAALLFAVIIVPFGEELINLLRGKKIESSEAQTILAGLLRTFAVTATGLSLILASAGTLLKRVSSVTRSKPELSRNESQPNLRRPPLSAILLSAAFLLTAATLLIKSADRSFYFDEILAMGHDVTGPLVDAVNPRAMINHITAAFLARIGVFFGGESEAAARAGSIALTLLGMSSVCWAGWLWGRSWLSLVLPAAYLSTNGFVLDYGVSIRGYSSLMWFSVLLALTIARSWNNPADSRTSLNQASSITACGILGLALGSSHLFGLLYLGAIVLLAHSSAWLSSPLASNRQKRKRALLCATLSISLGLSLLIWVRALPWLFYYSGSKSSPEVGRALVRELSYLASGHEGSSGVILLAMLALSGLLVVRIHPGLRQLALTALVPTAALAGVSFLYEPAFLLGRFFAPFLGLGAVCLALAAGWLEGQAGFLRNPLRIGLLSAIVILGLPGTQQFLGRNRGYREQAKDITDCLRTSRDTRSQVLVLGQTTDPILVYYLPKNSWRVVDNVNDWESRRDANIPDVVASVGNDIESEVAHRLPKGWKESAIRLEIPPTDRKQRPLAAWIVGPWPQAYCGAPELLSLGL